MAGFEDLIRDTLAKQGEPTHANRARVYASARSALERMVVHGTDPDTAQAQRESLEAAIERIEDEYASRISGQASVEATFTPTTTDPSYDPTPEVEPAAPPPAETIVVPTPPPPPPTVAVAPVVPADPRIVEPSISETHPSGPRSEQRRPSRRDAKRAAKLLDDRRKGRPLVKLLLWLVILGGLAAAIWWAWNNGLERLTQLAPTVPAPSTTSSSEAAQAPEGWITVFDPLADIDAVVAGEAASTQIVRDGPRTWLRLASSADPDAGDAGRVRVRVPPGVMQRLSGRSTTFEATVRTAPGTQPHPFAVVCAFENGSCNRTRFDAGLIDQPFVFSADLGASEEAGALVFDTDLDNLGRAIDLGSIRVAEE